ncbi:MAG: hypothetical protein J0I21_21095 [Alphaproteobacteria bacterium]|nr:hypothetical protein [Alphaproteobacteria bacterium]
MTAHEQIITFFFDEGKRSGLSVGMSRSSLLVLSAVVAGLIAIAGAALWQEIAPGRVAAPALATIGTVPAAPPPLSADEETYAEALWPLHQEIVEASAGRLTSAGLAYAIDDHDARRLAAKVAPIRDTFHATREKVAAIPAPASLQAMRDRYLELLGLYEESATEMLEVARDGDDGHLIDAQRKSERAAEYLVKVGDVLWPGEHKPN